MYSIAPETILFAPSHISENLSCIASSVLLSVSFAVSIPDDSVSFMLPIASETFVFIASHFSAKKSCIAVRISFILSLIAVHIVVAVSLMPSSIGPKISFMPCQMDPKNSLTPVQACCQLPVKIPIKKSRIPRIASHTVCRMVAMIENAVSNTGAIKLQNPSQMVLIAPVTDSNVIPIPASLCAIPSINPAIVSLIWFHVAMILFRKSSLFFQSETNDPIRRPIAAMTARIGPAPIVVSAVPRLPRAPSPLARATFSFPTVAIKVLTAFMHAPIFVITVPITINTGPIAATIIAIVVIVLFCASDMPFSLSTNPCTADTMFLTVGIRISPKEIASS